MADARVEKLVNVLVNYSLELKPGQTFWSRTTRFDPAREAGHMEIANCL